MLRNPRLQTLARSGTFSERLAYKAKQGKTGLGPQQAT